MKKAIFCLLIIFIGCAPNIMFIPKSQSEFVIDFAKYTEKGFMFSPYQYLGKYESIGMITITVMPEASLLRHRDERFNGNVYKTEWEFTPINLDASIEQFYKKAVDMGANGVCDLKIISESKSYILKTPVTIPGVTISGFAIKRLEVQ
ncbi:hypothetical protein JW960_21650 [candidate division KSB1 bacterium]|nr:hypothetical protein [candidate division KSB1 bacterium]